VASGLSFDQAHAALNGARQKAMLKTAAEIDDALGLKESERSVIGAWSDGAENSVLATLPDASWDEIKLSAAMKGYVGDQKAVLAFKQDDGGDALLYQMHANGSLSDIHQRLLKDGLAFHSLAPTSDGADVYVADLDGSAHDGIKRAAEDFHGQVTYQRGKAEFIGTTKEDGTDRDIRDDARRAYEGLINQSPVQGGAEVWRRHRDRWSAALQAIADALRWLADAARKTPQPKHPRSGKFAKAHVVAREIRRHKKTGQFQKQGVSPEAQRRAELTEMRFERVPGRLDVMTQGDDRVCDVCDGISANGPYTINTARSLIPAHPNCRCLFVAAGSNLMRQDAQLADDWAVLGDPMEVMPDDGLHERGLGCWCGPYDDEGVIVHNATLQDFDPDQPRDEKGQWTTAYHGSAATFEKFDLEHMLKGEADIPSATGGYAGGGYAENAYGHGIYLAENPKVAEAYGEQIGASHHTAGHVYQVRIHAAPDEFLDWDKPLEQQPQAVRDLVKSAPPGTSGGHLMMGWIGTGPKGAARLVKAGIKGVRYLDQGSRGAGTGTHNYVVMDPSAIEITHRDGVRLSKSEAHDAWLEDFDPNQPRDEIGRWTDTEARSITNTDLMEGPAPHAKGSRSVTDVAKDLTARSQAGLKALGIKGGKITLDNTTPAHDELLARAIAHETQHALKDSGNAADWYRGKVESAMRVAALIHPEIATDQNARTAMAAALAITSQGETVGRNTVLADEAYTGRDKQGRFPGAVEGSAQGKDMAENFAKYNSLVDSVGLDKAREFLAKTMTVKELNDYGYKFGSLPKDSDVYGSAMFGPKLGNGFFQNLTGNYSPVTQDLWFMRTWGRLTGTLMDTTKTEEGRQAQFDRFTNALKKAKRDVPKTEAALGRLANEIYLEHERDYRQHGDEYKSGKRVKGELALSAQALLHGTEGIREHPGGGAERQWRERVVNRAREILESRGTKLSNADLQATIWYPEKTLYERLGSKGPIGGNADYAGAFSDLAKKKGHSDAAIAKALRGS
jgi:hypothetical protein